MALPAAMSIAGGGVAGVAAAAEAELPTSVADFGFVGGVAALIAGVVVWLDRRSDRLRLRDQDRIDDLQRQRDQAREEAHQTAIAARDARIAALETEVVRLRSELATRPQHIIDNRGEAHD